MEWRDQEDGYMNGPIEVVDGVNVEVGKHFFWRGAHLWITTDRDWWYGEVRLMETDGNGSIEEFVALEEHIQFLCIREREEVEDTILDSW